MNVRVFKISGKSQRGKREVDFIGGFIQKEGIDIIEGYMEEQGYTPYDPVRYIKGLYIEKANRLAFVTMCINMVHLAYMFCTLKEQGFWSGVHPEAKSLSCFGDYETRATVKLEEVQDENEKQEMVQKVATVKEKASNASNRSYQEFLESIEKLPNFLRQYNNSIAWNTDSKNVRKIGKACWWNPKHSAKKS